MHHGGEKEGKNAVNLWTGTNLDEEEDTIPLEGKEAFGTDVGRVAKGAFSLGLPRSVFMGR